MTCDFLDHVRQPLAQAFADLRQWHKIRRQPPKTVLPVRGQIGDATNDVRERPGDLQGIQQEAFVEVGGLFGCERGTRRVLVAPPAGRLAITTRLHVIYADRQSLDATSASATASPAPAVDAASHRRQTHDPAAVTRKTPCHMASMA